MMELLFVLLDGTSLIKLSVAVVVLYSLNVFRYDKYKYSADHVADSIIETNTADKTKSSFWARPSDLERSSLSALKLNKSPVKINLEDVTKKQLMQYVREVNSALFHISGNCQLLSDVLMYNLLNEQGYFLSAKNTFPILRGATRIDEYLLGQFLQPYTSNDEQRPEFIPEDDVFTWKTYSNTIDQLEKRILACHHKTKEKVFQIIASGYHIPLLGAGGHVFNAIILQNEQNEPVVQFLDAWLKSNPLPTKKYLNQKFSGKDVKLFFQYCPENNRINQFSFEVEIKKDKTKSQGFSLK